MGQQKGAVKFTGTVGDITVAKTKDGYIVKEKSEISQSERDSSTVMEPVRHNAIEFSASGKAVKLLRWAFKEEIAKSKDRKLTARMQKLMMAVTKADPIHNRGERNPQSGPLQLFEKFDCNADALLMSTLQVDLEPAYDRVTGAATLHVKSFLPKTALSKPDSATHYSITLAAAQLNFANEKSVKEVIESEFFPINAADSAPLDLQVTLPAGSALPVFLIAGVRFSQFVNGFNNPVIGGGKNALAVVLVDTN